MDLTLSEVAEKLRVSRKSIYRWILEQKLPAYRMGRQFRFAQTDINAWLQKNRMEAPVAGSDPFPRTPDAMLSLANLLKRGGIYYKVEGTSKEEVIKNAVDAMVLPPGIVAPQFLEMVLWREHLASTALGKGIAFPHPREPFQLDPELCSVSICFLDNPVDFLSLDGQPATTLFFGFPSNLRHHLQIEARICHICGEENFVRFLKGQPGRREIVEYIEEFEKRTGTQWRADEDAKTDSFI